MTPTRSASILVTCILLALQSQLHAQTWQRSADLAGEPISDIVQYTDGTLFAASDQSGVFRSTDNGASWTQVNTGLTQNFVHDLLISGTRIFAAANGGLFVTTNKGASWNRASTTLTGGVRRIVKAKDGSLVAAALGVWRSTDNGANWSKSSSISTNNILIDLTMAPSGALYLAASSELFVSTTNGISWTSVKKSTTFGESYWSVAVSPQNEIYVGTNRYLMRSGDLGATWQTLNTSTSPLQHNAVLFNSNGDIIAGTSEQGSSLGPGLFVSKDHGVSWTPDDYFADIGVKSLFFAADGRLLVGTGFDGVIRSMNAVKSSVALPPDPSGESTGSAFHSFEEMVSRLELATCSRFELYNSAGLLVMSGSHGGVIQEFRTQPGAYLLHTSRAGDARIRRVALVP